MELSPIDIRNPARSSAASAAFARSPNGGLIDVVNSGRDCHRDLIIALAAQHRLPAVYPYRYFVGSGGLVSYGPRSH